jgi:beta-galactosidase
VIHPIALGGTMSLLAFCPVALRAAPPLTVRVDTSTGAPRLLINGQPRRARIFYGQPAAGTLPLSPQALQVSFEFTPDQTELSTATMHFRFGQIPGDVYLDDIRVTDLDTGRDTLPVCRFEGGDADFAREWFVWPPAPQNTVGTVRVEPNAGSDGSAGLRVHLKAPPGGVWPDFHIYHKPDLALVQGHRYRVTFRAKADPERNLTVAFYRPGTTYVYLGGPPGPYESEVRLAAGAGVDLVSFSIPLPWPAPGELVDWQGVDSICETTLRANPRALLLPRIPVYVPDWWKKTYPDELMRWEDGLHAGIASPASQQYRRDASARLAALVEHLEAKFGDRFAGCHPCGQNTGEWFYMDSWERPLNGYAPCDAAAFRQWLRRRYANAAALRTAWGDPSADFDTAAVPSPAARHAAPDGVFRDPAAERPTLDFTEFQQESMADCVCEFARVVRRATQGRKLVVFFYGYVFEFGALPTGPGTSGHYALRRVLDCPDIDILCSPISYYDRGPGQSAPCMTAAESVALAKKMWLNEDDTRTYLAREENFPGAEHVVRTLAETNGELVRNVAQEALRNFATWWMDLPATGWFNDPGMWAEMARLRRLDEPLLRRPIPFRPQVATVLDERSMTRVAEGGTVVTRPGVYEARAALGRMGAPYGQYLLDDVARGRVHAKLYVFLDAWCLSAEQRAALLKATRGSVRVWCYAPGYFDEYRKSPEAMQELTGFTLKAVSPEKAWATPTKLGRRMGLLHPFGAQQPVRPLFAAADAEPGEVLATYPDGSAAVALRRVPSGPSLFVGAPGLTPELLRLAARMAGAHLYAHTDCCLYANGPYLALHATQDGSLALDTGRSGKVMDVLTGALVGRGPRLTLRMKRGETRVLKTGQ